MYIFFGSDPFERNGVTLLSVVVTYVTIGVVGGGIVGILRPFTRHRLGAHAVGFIVGLLGAAGITVVLAGSPLTWEVPQWGSIAVVGSAAGWLVGSELWNRTGAKD